jgi:hypothetical protein
MEAHSLKHLNYLIMKRDLTISRKRAYGNPSLQFYSNATAYI